MYFSQRSGIVVNDAYRRQWSDVQEQRNASNAASMSVYTSGQALSVNAAGVVPRDAYIEMDDTTTRIFREDNGDTFLNDLMPLSRSVGLGKMVVKHRVAGDMGNAQSSMSGQIGVLRDQTEYDFGNTLVPIHDVGYGRNWREQAALQQESFNALADDNENANYKLREHIADGFMDGWKNKDGSLMNVDGAVWEGVRNDIRVSQFDLGGAGINTDFTNDQLTGEEIKDKFIQVKNHLRITNNIGANLSVYISREIESNWERSFSTVYGAGTIMEQLAKLAGVGSIKSSNKLVGNEIMAFPLQSNLIRPVVGMGINTVAMPRLTYNANHDYSVWGAIGYQIKVDADNKKCAMFAKNITP